MLRSGDRGPEDESLIDEGGCYRISLFIFVLLFFSPGARDRVHKFSLEWIVHYLYALASPGRASPSRVNKALDSVLATVLLL